MTTLTEAQRKRFEERFGKHEPSPDPNDEAAYITAITAYAAACEDAEGLLRALEKYTEDFMAGNIVTSSDRYHASMELVAALKQWRGDDKG